jgi:circadian clock protein KaiB
MAATIPSGADITEDDEIWYLRLYIAGQSPKSLHALANLTKLCEAHLAGRYDIEVVDLVERPDQARDDDILAIPTLVRRLPPPLRKVIGDLSDAGRVLVGLRLTSDSSA